jgi:3-deoxy-D-manno-octulosonic-acid transferase
MFVRTIKRHLRRTCGADQSLSERVLFCVIPRHPQRFDEAAALLEKAGLSHVRRSTLIEAGDSSTTALQLCANANVLLGDTLGEMAWYYAISQVAIVGGSFAPLGGQNFIEACAIGVPVLVGPHTRNFEQAVVDAVDEGAALRLPNAEAAVQRALQLLDEPQRLTRMGEAGSHWVQKHAGAVARVVAGLSEIKR